MPRLESVDLLNAPVPLKPIFTSVCFYYFIFGLH